MIKLGLIAVIVLSLLGVIIWSIFSSNNPKTKEEIPILNNSKSAENVDLSNIKVSDIKIKQPVTPLSIELFAPKKTIPSGSVKLSEVINKILIELKSDSSADTTGIIYSGSCTQNGKIVYPLASLKNGKSETIWEISMEELKKQLPLSIKVYKDLKNLKNYTRCADIK